MKLLALLRQFFRKHFPSDEQLMFGEALPTSLAELKARREAIEVCRQVAVAAVQRNCTPSPIRRSR